MLLSLFKKSGLMNKKIKFKLWHLLAVSALLIALFLPLPVYIDAPGAAQDTSSYVKVKGHRDNTPGKFMLVYVKQVKATPVKWVLSFANKYADRVPAQQEVGNYSDKEMQRIQTYYMSSSIAEAKYRSLTMAGADVKRRYIGLYVMSVLKDSNFADKLRVGDVVTRVNGKHYNNSYEYIQAIKQISPDQKVRLTYLRGKKQKNTAGKLIRLPNSSRHGLGITLTDRVKTSSDVPITANMEGIGGPSAGLMLTLQMYTQLSHKDLLRGRQVAGTGTIESDGSVGQIGGIEQKVVSANKAKAEIFFAPNNQKLGKQDNYLVAKKTATEINSNMKIVPVKNVNQAVSYLQNNK